MRSISYLTLGEKRIRVNGYLLGLAALLLVMVVGSISYFVALDKVTVVVDGKSLTQKTLAVTVDQVLKESAIRLGPGDEVSPGLRSSIREGLAIYIERAVPIHIKYDGRIKTVMTVPVPVREALTRAGIRVGKADKISLPMEAMVKKDQEIKIIRVTTRVITEDITLKAPLVYVKDKSLNHGSEKVVQEGKSGRAQRTIKVVYEDGRETGRKTLAYKVIAPAVRQIVALGIRPVIYTMTTSRGRTIRYTGMKVMNATAYYPGPESCGKEADGYTATGKRAGYGIVAVDRRVIPLGTMLYIEGYGVAEAADVGAAIKGNKIDLCYDTYREAKMFGRRNVKVYFIVP